jgi:hypothetical protein
MSCSQQDPAKYKKSLFWLCESYLGQKYGGPPSLWDLLPSVCYRCGVLFWTVRRRNRFHFLACHRDLEASVRLKHFLAKKIAPQQSVNEYFCARDMKIILMWCFT